MNATVRPRGLKAGLLGLACCLAVPAAVAGADTASATVRSEGPSASFIGRDTRFSDRMLNWQGTVTGKPLAMLQLADEGVLEKDKVMISGTFWGSHMKEASNKPGKFPILSRFPSQHSSTSKTGEVTVINNAALGIAGRLGELVSLYVQPEYTELDFPGENQWELRKAYALVGNLSRSPVYAYFGRGTVDFGWLDGYNPFTHSASNHFFRVESEDPVLGVGYSKSGLHVIGTLIHSGRQWRVADIKGDGGWRNGALSARHTTRLHDEVSLSVGAGYLYSSIYNRNVAHHRTPPADAIYVRNAAYDLFAEVRREPFRMAVEYTTTAKDWPATGARVAALTVQGAYDFALRGVPVTLSAVYSEGRQGPDGSPFEKLSQTVLGMEAQFSNHLSIGLEYVRNEGFVPLINIANVSDQDVHTDTLIVGVKLRF